MALFSAFNMEDLIKSKLNTKVLKKVGSGSGCINEANIYETDAGKVFLKYNTEPEAEIMFQGELESLKELANTQTVKVPKPYFVGNTGKKSFLLMEYINMRSLQKYSTHLGKRLAELHLHNINQLKEKEKSESFVTRRQPPAVEKFGFHVPTACGYLPQKNIWSEDWMTFYVRQKLQHQVDLVINKKGSREICELWSQLQLIIPAFFVNVQIKPSLLHGDLWIGNSGETQYEPVIFDPASFYGHHEYDLAIAIMFYGFGTAFFNSYHSLIPKANGFEERQQLYLLFHHLNHWNHFGSHKDSSLQIMRKLVKKR